MGMTRLIKVKTYFGVDLKEFKEFWDSLGTMEKEALLRDADNLIEDGEGEISSCTS